MRLIQLLPAAVCVLLSACGGGSPGASVAPVTNPNAGMPGGDSDGTPRTVTTVCNKDSGTAHFCDQTVTSPAPPTSGSTVARPDNTGVQGCRAGWEPGGATTAISTTVFIPQYNDGDTMPVILHSHGWGGSRVTNDANPRPDASANTFQGIFDMVPEMWRQGYIMISFDQRGWGGSQGQAEVIDPCYEAVDAIAILDWVEQNLPVARDSNDDPIIGAIGGSYGGAYQMMLAAMDDRLDAIMPVATWNTLSRNRNELLDNSGAQRDPVPGEIMHSALINNEVTKGGYIQGLCLLANIAPRDSGQPGATLNPLIAQACSTVQAGLALNGQTLDNINTRFRELFSEHGMGNPNLRPGRAPMDVDVYLVQGMRDMVFDGLEAYDNYLFFTDPANNSASADVRLVTTDGGHMLTTYAQVNPGYQIQGDNDCGSVDMFDTMIEWFDDKLRGQGPHSIPDVCIALNSDAGVQLSAVPIGNSAGAFAIGSAGSPVFVTTTTATNLDLVGSPRQFLPLMTMPNAGYLAGIPIFTDVMVQAGGSAPPPFPGNVVIPNGVDATAFVAIGIRKADGTLLEVDDQITPIRRANAVSDAAVTHQELRMAMIGDQLEAGDELGLLLYQRNGYFQVQAGATQEYQSNGYAISGSIEIPVFDSNGVLIAPPTP